MVEILSWQIPNGISPEQKILEVLSINPPLTASELEEKTKLHIDNINKILHRHTIEFSTIQISCQMEKFIFLIIQFKKDKINIILYFLDITLLR